MSIMLELVRQVLKEAFGFDSFVASFITEVREDKDHPTAGIAKEGVCLRRRTRLDDTRVAFCTRNGVKT